MSVKHLAAGLAFALMATTAFAGHHLDGTWVLAVTLEGGQGGEATLKLEEQAGGKLTGTYTGALGSLDLAGTVKGNEVEIKVVSEAGEIVYRGTADGDNMEGTCSYGDLGSGTFKGKRSAE